MHHSILTAIFRASRLTERHPFLNRLQSGEAGLATWQNWEVQKYQVAGQFLSFLETGLKKARESNLPNTAQALEQNLCDEKGVTPKGKRLAVGSHEDWRLDFSEALGVTTADLRRPSLAFTLSYALSLKELNSSADVWRHLGALMAMEYAIAREMTMIEAGLDNTPELKARFDKSTQEGKRGRLYVSHHAAHDMKRHFPDLLKAFERDLGRDTEKLISGRLKYGAFIIGKARQNFYDGLEFHFPA